MNEQGSGFKSRIRVYELEDTELNMKKVLIENEATWMQVLLKLVEESQRRQEHGTA